MSRVRTGAVEAAPIAARRRVRWRGVRGALFVLPWAIGFVLFQLFPFLASLFLSFTEWNFSRAPRLVGLENYRRLLLDDPLRQAVRVLGVAGVVLVHREVVVARRGAVDDHPHQRLPQHRAGFHRRRQHPAGPSQ